MMAKLTVEHFANEVATALGGRLVALLLYGSAARGTHVPDRSDVNTLLICDAVDEDLFARLERPVREWVKAGHPAPLMLTQREWQTSADAFAIEYEDIREAHRLLAGRDPWPGIAVQREHVRRQLEHELMGKRRRVLHDAAGVPASGRQDASRPRGRVGPGGWRPRGIRAGAARGTRGARPQRGTAKAGAGRSSPGGVSRGGRARRRVRESTGVE